MANTYYQPGVYIVEANNLPGTITSVPTAIPAFVGYTQKAMDKSPDDLLGVPKHITSFLDYVKYYGTGPNPTVTSVVLDNNNNFVSADIELEYKMYNSVQMFYANGGGDCVIMSVGNFHQTPALIDFIGDGTSAHPGCFVALAKDPLPTLLVFPDNDALGAGKYNQVYQAALQQCGELQDRFLIADVKFDAADDYDDQINQFRSDIGINDLDRGAAYTPWLEIVSPMTIGYTSFKDHLFIGTTQVSALANLTTDTNLQAAAQNLDNLVADIDTIDSGTTSLLPTTASYNLSNTPPAFTDLTLFYEYLKTQIQQKVGNADADLEAIFQLGYSLINQYNKLAFGASSGGGIVSSTQLATQLQSLSQSVSLYASLSSFNKLAVTDTLLFGAYSSPAIQGTSISNIYTYASNVSSSVDLTFSSSSVDTNTTYHIDITVNGNLVITVAAAPSVNDVDHVLSGWVTALSSTSNSDYTITSSGTVLTIKGPLSDGDSTNNYSVSISHSVNGGTGGVLTYTPTTALALTGGKTTIWGANTSASNLYTAASNASLTLPNSGTHSATSNEAFQNATYLLTTPPTGAASLDSVMGSIIQFYSSLYTTASTYESNQENALASTFPAFKAILSGINNTPISMPPSGAIAGLYAYVDNDRGVWKAPANVSVSGILGPNNPFANSEYDNLNIDINAGKSINAIRSFTGKGTLVWGARTLAGNDENWKYVNVRRTMTMIEQSMKSAFAAYVFEPNDAITWMKVRCEGEAYLNSLWKAGALVGSKPEYAYFVKVGLGVTMTAEDILNGFMNVQVGVAISHPAEFIVMTFSQLLQQ